MLDVLVYLSLNRYSSCYRISRMGVSMSATKRLCEVDIKGRVMSSNLH